MDSAIAKVAPVVTLDLDRERHLKYDFNAIAELETATGLNLVNGSEKVFNARYIRAFVWAGLLHESPDLTIPQVGAMLHFGNATEVLAKAMEALNLAKPEPVTESDPTPPSPAIQ